MVKEGTMLGWLLERIEIYLFDPADDPSDEPMPNGGRINVGAYGGTAYASTSEAQ